MRPAFGSSGRQPGSKHVGRRSGRSRNETSPRRLTLGSGTVELQAPRVRDVPPGQEPFGSKIVRKYPRRGDTIDETFLKHRLAQPAGADRAGRHVPNRSRYERSLAMPNKPFAVWGRVGSGVQDPRSCASPCAGDLGPRAHQRSRLPQPA